ncbi:hypothetical protein [Porphyromonas sp. COT-290 OH860]|uniref:DUF6427 family protein n=1 Tax=Porphyromonas sp. COT-290 OH860 TaxID=1515615 RepID=UPI00052DB090|nr:hypothetical protein [Porphyromonas sp. COT-290 OH860]KGN81880.1 hypothetical protein HQ41_09550 [Porphyromonas sp. COT-290 OH860]
MYAPSRRLSSQGIIALSLLLYTLGLLLYALPLDPWRTALYEQMGWRLPVPLDLSYSSLLEFAVLVPALSMISIRLTDFFFLHDKYEQRLSLLILPLIMYAGLYQSGSYDGLVIAGSLGVLWLLLGSYQDTECPSRMVLVGALLGGLGLYHAKALLLLPVLVLMLYRLRCLSLRNLLATLHGLALTAFIALPIFYLLDQDLLFWHLGQWVHSWGVWGWTMEASGTSYSDLLPLIVLVVFLLVGVGMHYVRAQGENVRQREQEASLIQLSIGGIACAILSSESVAVLYLVICVPIVTLLTRGIGQLRGRAQRIALSTIAVLLLLTAIFH